MSCNACRILSFGSIEEQRAHYREDYHRYNLLRKTNGLPPVSKEDFERRAAAAAKATQKVEFKGTCKECKKTFGSEKLLQQHLISKKHKQIAAANAARNALKESKEKEENPASDSGESEVAAESENVRGPPQAAERMEVEDEEEEEEGDDAPIGPDVCIFCNHESKDLEENCKHMLEKHGFFIPDQDYLVDKEGLINYCSEKVKIGNICLVCNGRWKTFFSARAVQQHMQDLSHCRLLYEEGEDLHEYESFYDFSTSYPDEEGGEGEGEEGTPLVNRQITINEFGELELLDGRVVGHRQYERYYRQAKPRHDTRPSTQAERAEQQLRLLGTAAAASANETQLSLHSNSLAIERQKRMEKRALFLQQREQLKLQIKQNKLNRTFTRVFEC